MHNNRSTTQDTARGLGIIFVSVYHLVYRSQSSIADEFIRGCIWLILPFFFILSGFNYKPGKFTPHQNITRRLKALLIPTLKYTASLMVIGAVYCVYVHDFTMRDVLRDVIFTYLRPEFSRIIITEWGEGGILFENVSAVWFVWTLCFTYLLFFPIAEYSRRSRTNLILSVIILLALGIALYDFSNYISWSLTLTPVYAATMLLGVGIAGSLDRIHRSTIISVISFIVFWIMFYFWGTDLVVYNVLGTIGKWSVIPFFIQVFIGGYFIINLSFVLEKYHFISRILIFIGRNSLIFLIFHCAFAVVFDDLLHTYIKPGPYWYVTVTPEIFLKSLIVWLLSMLSCSVLSLIKEKYNNTYAEEVKI